MKTALVCLSILSLVSSGCITSDIANSIGDLACGLYRTPDRKLHGSEDFVALEGVCDDETCNEAEPLAVGADHRFKITIKASSLVGKDRKDIELVSEDASVVDLADLETNVYEEERDPYTDELVLDAIAVELSGDIQAKKAGSTQLLLKEGDTVLDRYEFTLADIHEAHVELLEDDAAGDDLAQRGLELLVGAAEAKVAAVATAKDGRNLVLSNANVVWTVEDPTLVELDARPYSHPCDVRGPGAELTGLVAGSTEVNVEIGDIEQTIDVMVKE